MKCMTSIIILILNCKYFNLHEEGVNAFNEKDYEKSVILWENALYLIPDHNNTEVFLNNIDSANNNQKK